MNTAIINIKTEETTKKQAQKIAQELGISLSSLLNAYLKQIIRTKKVEFDLREEPSDYLIKSIKRAERNIKEGKVSPAFKTGKEAIEWLEMQGI